MFPCRLDLVRVRVEPVDEETVVGSQRRRQRAVTAADVDDEAALDPGDVQNVCRMFLRGGWLRGDER